MRHLARLAGVVGKATMAAMKLSEQMRAAYLAVDRKRRSAVSRALYSPFLRWRYGSTDVDQLLIVPQDLRTADPSFWNEIELGQFGLAGTIAPLGGHSPFDVKPPNIAWARALHGFGWLRHLDAAQSEDARDTARRLAVEWTIRSRSGTGVAWEPAVMGRRLISWISHADLLLEGADPKTYDAIASSLGVQLVRLSAGWREGPEGYPRLLALTALVLADLAVAGHDRQLPEAEAAFSTELARQILPDGGHISRDPSTLVEIMLDLLPVRQCFASRSRPLPPALTKAMSRMLAMLRHMRIGDGMLARFNGVSVSEPAGLATVLAYDDRQGALPTATTASRYARLERAGTILLMDAGSPPPVELAGQAHAGCLSFEVSSATRPIFVNGGSPGPADADWRPTARATASHNTLCLAETSSSKLVANKKLEELIGAQPIRSPDHVTASMADHGGDLEIVATHDGYRERFSLMHRRTLTLSASGRRLIGIDRLEGSKRSVRLRHDLPFAIHFHLHLDAACRGSRESPAAEIVLKDGQVWSFSVEGAAMSIEESTYFADSAGPSNGLQIVARGATFGESEVRWVLERLD